MRFKYGLGLLLYTHSRIYVDLRACYAGYLSSRYVNLLTSWLSSNSNVILQLILFYFHFYSNYEQV